MFDFYGPDIGLFPSLYWGMSKRPSKKDFERVRAVIQREMASGRSFDEAAEKAAAEEPEAHKRIVES